MANLTFKSRFRAKRVIYSMNRFILTEYNEYTNCIFDYDLTRLDERDFFQARLKHNAKYGYNIAIDSYLLYYLHFIKWL